MNIPYRLHYAPDNASLIIRIILEELSLPYTAVLVDRSTQAQNAPDFLRINPLGMIPVLETPNGTIFETAAIALHLSEEHGALFPVQNGPARIEGLKWLFALSNGLHANLRKMFYPEKTIGSDPALQHALRIGLARQLNADFLRFEALALSSSQILGGATLSILDIYLSACLRWAQIYPTTFNENWLSIDNLPAIYEIASRLENRASVKSTILAEGLGTHPFTSPRLATPPEGSAT